MNQTPDIKAGAIEQMTLEGVVGMADQVDAAVREVMEAWQVFCYGPSPEAQFVGNPPHVSDKLEQTGSSLRESVNVLHNLALAIRGRA